MHLKYRIESITSLGGNQWDVRYEVWAGCACNKIKRAGTILKDTMPTLSDVKQLEFYQAEPYKVGATT